jgi:hypothetical protein
LEPFIPHLQAARFLGGEPFLITMYYQIWEMIVRINPKVDVTIVTNGTILNDRVKAALAPLRARINVSLDSLDRDNYERIRINASFDRLIENLRYFQRLVEQKNTTMTVNVCPMQHNWHELPDFLAFCNANNMHLFFNTVLYPEEASLRWLRHSELGRIIEYLEDVEVPNGTPVAAANRVAYFGVIRQLRSFRDDALPDYDYDCFNNENLDATSWVLRVAAGNRARLNFLDEQLHTVRVPIEHGGREAPWDIQLNRACPDIKANHHYVVAFRARADKPRRMAFGVSRDRPPWNSLGLYRSVDLTSDWRSFEADLLANADEDNARIHFDIGDCDIAVEVTDLRLRSRPTRLAATPRPRHKALPAGLRSSAELTHHGPFRP